MVYIYILKLRQNKYYIGKTNNPFFRLEEHFKHGGSQWTKKYKPEKVEKIIPNCDDFDEDSYTLRYMSKYGIENVRGGQFVRLDLPEQDLLFIKNSLRSSTNRCFECGSLDHFVRDCKQRNNYIELVDSVELSSGSDDSLIIDPLDPSYNSIESVELIMSEYDKGYKKGFNDGHIKGYKKGKNFSVHETYENAKTEWYRKGHQEGYYEGYDDGRYKNSCCIVL